MQYERLDLNFPLLQLNEATSTIKEALALNAADLLSLHLMVLLLSAKKKVGVTSLAYVLFLVVSLCLQYLINMLIVETSFADASFHLTQHIYPDPV